MEKLIAGYRSFRSKNWVEHRALFESLAENGQRPQALVIACVDSRVDPAMIFDSAPGTVLTVRNVANLVPPYAPDHAYHGTSAALEFGVRVLEVRDLIVLGHSSCGGVQALLNGAPEKGRDFIAPWMELARPALERASQVAAGPERDESCEQEVVKVSLANLLTFPWIAERVAGKNLKLHGAWFDIRGGVLKLLQADQTFQRV